MKKYVILISFLVLFLFIGSFDVNAQTSRISSLNLTRNLSVGASGADVTELQQFLISQGLLSIANPTGYFGPLTKGAVQSFQIQQGVVSSQASQGYGRVGPLTRASIVSVSSGSTNNTSDTSVNISQSDMTTSRVNPKTTLTTVGSNVSPSTKFSIGDSIKTTINLNVKSVPNSSGVSLGIQTMGSLGTILLGPVFVPRTNLMDDTNWYKIDYATGPDGWSVEDYLVKSVQTLPSGAPTVTFSANPTSITTGQSSILAWASTNATSCSASGGWSGSKATSVPVFDLAFENVSPTQTTTYTLTCTGLGGVTSQSVTVTVANTVANIPPTATAGPDLDITLPTNFVSVMSPPVDATDSDGTVSSHVWSFLSGPVTPSISAPGNKATNFSGFTSVGRYVFRLTVTDNKGATGIDDMQVMVFANTPPPAGPVISVDIKANGSDGPIMLSSGQALNLTWTSTNPTSLLNCSLFGWGGVPVGSGLITYTVGNSQYPTTSSTTYPISCTSLSGGTVSDNVTVSAYSPTQTPITSFTATPATISSGQSSTLAWIATNATNCVVNPGNLGSGFNSSVSVSPTVTTTYTVLCQGSAGVVTKSVTVTVTPTSTLSITTSSPLPNAKVGQSYSVALNTSGGPGSSYGYSWSVNNGVAGFPVTGLGFSSSYGTSNNITGTPAKVYINGVEQMVPYTFTFNVTVTAGSQTITKQFTLTVDPVTPPPTINETVDIQISGNGSSYSNGPLNLASGQSVWLTWQSSGVNYCSIVPYIFPWSIGDRDNGSRGPISFGSTIYPPVSGLAYTITCQKPSGGTVTDSVTAYAYSSGGVKTDIKATNVFNGTYVDSNLTLTSGQTLYLWWDVSGISSSSLCSIKIPNYNYPLILSIFNGYMGIGVGNTYYPVSAGTVYTLSCPNSTGGTVTDTITVYGPGTQVMNKDKNGQLATALSAFPIKSTITVPPLSSPPTFTTQTTEASLTKTLSRGLSSGDVVVLQIILTKLGFFSDSATGFYGPVTETAIQEFQKANDIVSSGTPKETGYGVAGPKTRAKLLLLNK
ncbi:MAG: peptidoglycan-binding protein [bacterium]|nr:peptidoglycan-binding protein [bacterium]